MNKDQDQWTFSVPNQDASKVSIGSSDKSKDNLQSALPYKSQQQPNTQYSTQQYPSKRQQWQPPNLHDQSEVPYALPPTQINYSYVIQGPVLPQVNQSQYVKKDVHAKIKDDIKPIKITKSINIMIFRIIIWTVFIIVLIFLYQLTTNMLSVFLSEYLKVYWNSKMTMYFVLILIFLVGVIIIYLKWMSSYYLVYSDRIVFMTGVIKKDDKDVFLDDVLAVELIQDNIAEMFKYGTLELKYLPLTGTEKSDMLININKPEYFQNVLRLFIKRSRESLSE